jgi:hypothetical protein
LGVTPKKYFDVASKMTLIGKLEVMSDFNNGELT